MMTRRSPQAFHGIGLDIGSHAIKVVELRRAGRGIVLAKWATVRLTGKEADVAAAVQQLFRQQRLRRRPLALAMPGGMTFVRVVKPIVSGRLSLEQALRFEAQHVVPFPLTEVLWDYHSFDPSASPPLALLVAVKRDLVEQRMQAAGATRASATLMDVGPLAVCNVMHAAYPKQLGAGQAVLHWGAQSADLVVWGRRQFWVRSVPLGGDRVTETLAAQLGVSFEEAERIKVRQERGDLDPTVLTNAITPVVDELAGEITRSIEYFQQQEAEQSAASGRSAPAGESPSLTQLWLSGGAVRMAGVVAQLTDRLRCPVQLINPCQTLTLGCPTPPPNPEAYSVAIGLALRALGPQRVEINLLHEMALREREQAERRLFLTAGGVCAAAALVILGTFLKDTYDTKQAQLERVDRLLDTYQQFHPKIRRLLDEQTALTRRIDTVSTVMHDRGRWLRLLREIHGLLPQGVWLTEFVSSRAGLPATRGGDNASETATAAAVPPARGARTTANGDRQATSPAAAMMALLPPPAAKQELYLAGHATSFQGVNEFVTRLKSHPRFSDVRPLSSSIVKSAMSNEELVAFALVLTPADAQER